MSVRLARMVGGNEWITIGAISRAGIVIIINQRADARRWKTWMINLFIVELASTDKNSNDKKGVLQKKKLRLQVSIVEKWYYSMVSTKLT